MSLLVKHIASHQNNRIAVADENRTITYNELADNISHVTEQLKSTLNKGKNRIFLSGNNRVEFLELLLALLDTGNEIILIDPRGSTTELNALISEIPCNYILFEDGIFDNYYQSHHQIKTGVTSYVLHKCSDEITADESENQALYFCSSGSTGRQKVFGFTDEQLVSQFSNIAAYLQFTETDESLCPLTITHSHGLMISIPILLHGGCVHYLSPKNCHPANIINYVHTHKITLLTGVPYQYNLMLNTITDIEHPFHTLRFCFCGSAPMSAYLATSFYQKFGVRLNQAYGLSEIGPICFNLDAQNNDILSVGPVIPTIEYKIIDDKGKERKEQQEGELIVRASFMSSSYLNNKDATRSTFINGWIHTNDIVKADANNRIYIIGRKSDFINVAGYKIYPVEIEKALLSIDGIKEAVVVGVSDEAKGQLIKAVITTFYPMDRDEIKQHCRLHLSDFKIPHIIQFEEQLHQTSIHKVELSAYKNQA